METINFKAVERSSLDVSVTIPGGNSERWTIQSQKIKYVNSKISEVIEIGYSASIDNTSDYLLEEDKSNNEIQITARNEKEGTSGLCVLTQNESGNKINLKITTPEEWEIHFNPTALLYGYGIDMSYFFTVSTNISGESGSMGGGDLYRNWIVNQNRYTINVYISNLFPSLEMMSWSCLDKNGNAFNPDYSLPNNEYFTTKLTGLGSYSIKKISAPPVSSSTTPILSSSFNPTKKYPLDLNFYWVEMEAPT